MPKITEPTVAEHRERTREALVEATYALVAERGFESVSLREIADRAGVTRTAIYNYAAGKVELLFIAVDQRTTRLRAEIVQVVNSPTPAAERLVSIIQLILVSYAPSARDLALLRTARSIQEPRRDEAVRMLHDELAQRLLVVVGAGQREGAFREVDTPLVVAYLVAVLDAALDAVLADPTRATSIASSTVAFATRALAAEPTPRMNA